MKELVKCVIASHKRPDACETADNISHTAICIPQSQAADYKVNYPNSEILAHPDDVIGLTAKFKWIYGQFPNVVIMDDDLWLARKWGDSKTTARVDPDTAYEIIQADAYVAKQLGAKLFGYSKDKNPVTYTGHEPFRLSGFVIGGIMGFLEGFPMEEMNSRIISNVDFYISCLNAFYFRYAFVNEMYCHPSKEGNFKSRGGMSDFRTVDTERLDYDVLKGDFGDVIVRKLKNPLRRLQHDYEKTLRLPY